MRVLPRNFALLLLAILASKVFAQATVFPSPEAAKAAIFPNKEFVEWVSEEGDLNGDGIKDIAMILTHSPKDGGLEKRLVVLSGVSGGKYSVLSVSSEYCDAHKFYNLKIVGPSLFVTQVFNTEPLVTNTLQFRFNNQIKDFELIGRENVSESFQEKTLNRRSENYISGTAIVYERKKSRLVKTKREHFKIPSLPRLNGFDCEKFN